MMSKTDLRTLPPFVENEGEWCHALAKQLWPICRSITGPGVRETLAQLKDIVPDLNVMSVKSGTQVFDWVIPDEWKIVDAFIADESGTRVVDFQENNLHVVGYSEPLDAVLGLEELNTHLYSLPDQPNAIPYVTSYYKRRWGFCVSQTKRDELKDARYRVVVRSTFEQGHLNYGEILLKGESEEEIFLSTYLCHPSMANNELSGPVVAIALAKWLSGLTSRKYSYRIIFIPETIGSITYLSLNLDKLKALTVAGFNISCIGDDRCYSYLPSRNGKTLSDLVAKHVLKHIDANYKVYTWLDRGSDERQYCAPGVDLPVATIMRSKYGEYPEYHTSLDDLENVVTPRGLSGGFKALQTAISILENDFYPVVTTLGEPQLGKRGLYPDISAKGSAQNVRIMMNMISFCDGSRSLLEIAEILDAPFDVLRNLISPLLAEGLITQNGQPV